MTWFQFYLNDSVTRQRAPRLSARLIQAVNTQLATTMDSQWNMRTWCGRPPCWSMTQTATMQCSAEDVVLEWRACSNTDPAGCSACASFIRASARRRECRWSDWRTHWTQWVTVTHCLDCCYRWCVSKYAVEHDFLCELGLAYQRVSDVLTDVVFYAFIMIRLASCYLLLYVV